MDIDWDARCECGKSRREHFRESVHGGMKPIPTPNGQCHGKTFNPSEVAQAYADRDLDSALEDFEMHHSI